MEDEKIGEETRPEDRPIVERPECDMCPYSKKGMWCPCKKYIDYLETENVRLEKRSARLEVLETPWGAGR